ncbi:FadR/GntR family transcriptional regulator [Marinobacterium ramblicola]|uniref:FadR/GntR family transcriptional regulator n=1 Tax=Marinobacterium ramblicola TaxID=2849041 RepID=UPI0031BA7D43
MPDRRPKDDNPELGPSDRLYARLIAQIAEGSLLPGGKLASERKLATEHGMSREMVRGALSRLAAGGYIQSAQGRASRLCNLMAPHLQLPLEGLGDDLEFQLQVMEIRALLEGECAWYAAQRASDAELALLAEEYALMYERGKSETTLAKARADLRFHMLIAESSHNLLLISFSQLFYERYFNAIYGVLSRTLKRFGRYPEGIRGQHAEIHRAIQARDAEHARRIAREHILYTRALLAAD